MADSREREPRRCLSLINRHTPIFLFVPLQHNQMNCLLSWSVIVSSCFFFYWNVDYSHAFLVTYPSHFSRHNYSLHHPLAAAPGVQVDSETAIRQALQNPATTVVDARSLEELQSAGFFRCSDTPKTTSSLSCRWVHAPASKIDAPLLELAATTLIPDLNAPVVVYCASGIRAGTSQRVLQQAGYTNVLNAGGLDDLLKVV